jgi:hypothetical protein
MDGLAFYGLGIALAGTAGHDVYENTVLATCWYVPYLKRNLGKYAK